jgi:hypothetical protein
MRVLLLGGNFITSLRPLAKADLRNLQTLGLSIFAYILR